MITHTEIDGLTGAELLDCHDAKVGRIIQILVASRTGEPEWVAVDTGLATLSRAVVPLAQAERAGKAVRVPYEKSMIEDAPHVLLGDDQLHKPDERRLYAHYGLDFAEKRSDSGVPSGQALGIQGKEGGEHPGLTDD